jgi:hypothetical protein
MAEREDMQRISDEFDPERCAFLHPKRGQCNMKSYKGSKYCLLHGGNKFKDNEEKQALRNYRLTQFSARAAELSHNSHVKSLRDEIGILRMMLEQRMNALNNTNEMIMHTPQISQLIMQINTLVTSAHKLELSLNEVLDKATLVLIADRIVELLSNNIENEALLEKIANELMVILEK